MYKRKRIILAVPRSGTAYTAKVCQLIGLDILHETKIGKDGVVSWKHIGEIHDVNDYGVILHQTRHPLKVISSMQTIMISSWKYISNYIDIEYNQKPLLLRCIQTYVLWNEMIARKAQWQYQVERLDEREIWKEWCSYMKKRISYDNRPIVIKNYHSRKYKLSYINITWKDIDKFDYWGEQLKIMSKKYGYK